ncbi:MAG: hypothetical protein Q9216_004979 [Gyalolechia sp. 2 TL-2023]
MLEAVCIIRKFDKAAQQVVRDGGVMQKHIQNILAYERHNSKPKTTKPVPAKHSITPSTLLVEPADWLSVELVAPPPLAPPRPPEALFVPEPPAEPDDELPEEPDELPGEPLDPPDEPLDEPLDEPSEEPPEEPPEDPPPPELGRSIWVGPRPISLRLVNASGVKNDRVERRPKVAKRKNLSVLKCMIASEC